jgi:hypothetical protein
MTPSTTQPTQPRFCSNCGTKLNPGARFCHECGAPVQASTTGGESVAPSPGVLRWAVPALALLAVLVLSAVRMSSRGDTTDAAAPLGAGGMGAPDISSMSPTERADRLFNRVMLLATQGKSDSAAFFAPMAIASIEALAPLDAHRRYDLGLVALAMGDANRAAAQADTILAGRSTHLLGLTLAARAAEAKGATAESRQYWTRLLESETDEIATGLQEYVDHDADIRAAVADARAR